MRQRDKRPTWKRDPGQLVVVGFAIALLVFLVLMLWVL